MWRAISHAVAVTALLQLSSSAGVAQGFQVSLTNKCNEPVEMWHVVEGSERMEVIGVGKSTSRTLGDGSPSNVFKKGRGGQATLAEISGARGMVWYDISIIPTGPKSGPEYCPNLAACKALTGGTGFNVPMQIVPSKTNGGRCTTLSCFADGCNDAYQFPKDDGKTHVCPGGTSLEIVFCPGGTGGQTAAPATPSPTPKPSPTTTPSPTPTPTQTQTPTPTPTSSASEERGMLDGNSSSPSNVASVDAGRLKLDISSAESEVAGDADSLLATGTATDAPVVKAGGDKTSTDAGVTEVSTQSKIEPSTGAEVYVLTILGAVGMVAVVAIVIVRKKKQMLDDENIKTPRDRAMTAAAALRMLTTPKDNVTVL